MVLQHKIPSSRELRLLRQDNLAFYAEINARAFSGAFMSEIPVQAYLKIIDEVKADFISTSPETDFSKSAQHYMDMMRGKFSSYDRSKSEPWIGTDTKGDAEVVVLLEPGARALRILRDLDSEHSFLAVSSLSSLSERLVSTAARLSGDTTQQIDALEARRDELDAEITSAPASSKTVTRNVRTSSSSSTTRTLRPARGSDASTFWTAISPRFDSSCGFSTSSRTRALATRSTNCFTSQPSS